MNVHPPPSPGYCLARCRSPAVQSHLCSFPASWGMRNFTEHPDSEAQVIVSQAEYEQSMHSELDQS